MSAFETAQKFFKACDGNEGWDGCRQYVADGAQFSCQSAALADVTTVEGYCEWLKGLAGGPLPGNSYTLHSCAWDEANSTATWVGTYHASHTGPGGPVDPTSKSTNTDYVYTVKMNGDGKVASMSKIWNDGYALAELGWA